MKKKRRAFLGFGSNLGDRIKNIESAYLSLSGAGCGIESVSRYYETKAEFYKNQPDFINCAASVTTIESPGGLLALVKGIEEDMGREPSFRNAPRVIDIDILLFENAIIRQEGLRVPHPGITERGFVLFPLSDIAGAEKHPVEGKSMEELLGMYLEKRQYGSS